MASNRRDLERGPESHQVRFHDDVVNVSNRSRSQGRRRISNSLPRGSNVTDFNNPGTWALEHHKFNFISEIRQSQKWEEEQSGTNSENSQKEEKAQATDQKELTQRRFRISFAELQRMKLRKLQITLVGNMVDMQYNNRESDGWEEKLQEYVQAMRDYEYMGTHSKEPSDPFLVSSERYTDHRILQRALGKHPEFFASKEYPACGSIGQWGSDLTPIGGLRNENHKLSEGMKFRKNLAMAVIGAVFLLAPMWIMVLHNTQYTALASTTAFVAVFGLVMTFFLEKEIEVMSSTAAYAAVLVVFVGVSA